MSISDKNIEPDYVSDADIEIRIAKLENDLTNYPRLLTIVSTMAYRRDKSRFDDRALPHQNTIQYVVNLIDNPARKERFDKELLEFVEKRIYNFKKQ